MMLALTAIFLPAAVGVAALLHMRRREGINLERLKSENQRALEQEKERLGKKNVTSRR